jgi:hypothetical protein
MTSLAARPQTLPASLIAALESDQSETALEHAFLQLARGGNFPLVLAILKVLVRAGLAGLGLRLLESSSGLLTAEPQVAALAERLAALPSGEWTAGVIEHRWKTNSDQLRRSHPHLQAMIDSTLNGHFPFRVFESASGNRHVIRADRSSKLEFVFPFVDQQAHASAAKLPEDSLSASYLLLGVPSAAFWARLLSIRTGGGYEPSIDMLESDPSIFGLWLALIDIPKPLSSDRVEFFIGRDCRERYRQHLLQQPCKNLPTYCTTNFRANFQPPVVDRGFHAEIAAARAARMRQSRAVLDQRFDGRDAKYWTARFGAAKKSDGAEPLRVVGFTNRYSTVIQHVMRDLCATFERRGCAFKPVTQPHSSCAAIDVVAELEKNPCDLIVVLNHLRSEYANAIPANVPYVCWIQDHMEALWEKRAGQSIGELDLVIGHSPQFMSQLYDYPIDRFLPSNNLTDAYIYSDATVPKCDADRFRCDVSYVSHASETADELIENATGSVAPFREMLARVKTLIVERMNAVGWVNSTELIEIMLRAERECSHPELAPAVRRTRVYPQVARLYDRIFRHQALEWVARWAKSRGKSLKLFGRGWERHPALREFACGEVASGYDLRCLCQATSINLQVNGYSSLHQRLLDAISSGGFVISRFNPADFAKLACERLQRRIRKHSISDLTTLCTPRATDPEVAKDCAEVERLTGMRIAPLTDIARTRHCELVRASNGMNDWLTDEGVLNALATMKFMPARVAADLPGFEQTTFSSQAELHTLLDRFVETPSLRREISASMRESVRQHDTYDSLVERILQHFAGEPATR